MRTTVTLAGALVVSALAAARPAHAIELPVIELTLDNGLRVLVLEDRSIPNAALYVGWRVGSRNEVPGITGLAHFFEHMMFSGGGRYGGRFDPIMEARGGSNNAYTTNDVTVYQDWFPAAQLPLVLDMEADRMRALRFRPDLVETERGVVASERRLSMEEPSELLREQLWATAYVAHPYQWSVLGWMCDIQSWRQSDLEAFFATHYAPNNATLVVVGDVRQDVVFRLVRERMGDIPRGPERRPLHTREPEQRGERRVVVEAAGAQLRQAMIAWHIPETAHADFAPIAVLERILLAGESSRLDRLLVDREQACLEVWGGFQGFQFDPSLFTVELTLRDGVDPARGEALVYEELGRLAETGPSEREVAKARNSIAASFVRELKTINGRASLLMDTELFFGGWRALPARLESVRAVTPGDVQRVVRRYFTRRNRTVATLELGGDAEPSPDEEGRAAGGGDEPGEEDGGGQAPPPPPAGPGPLPAPLSAAAPAVHLPAPVDFRLANGLRVLLVADRDVPLVSFQARVLGGSLEDPPGKEGVTALLARLLGRGAGDRDAEAFQEAVDFVGGLFGADAAHRWVTLSAEFLAQDADLGLELVADALTRPRFDPAEVARARGLQRDGIVADREDPSAVLGRYYGAWLLRGQGLARPVSGDEESVARLERDDVLAAARRCLAPQRTWLAVAGDFDPAEMRRKLEARLGAWRAEAAAPAPVAPPRPAAGDRVLLVDKPDALQSYFAFGNVGFDWSDPDFAARHLANTILGGRFTSRLNQALRIESGLTYGARSTFDDARRGVFAVSTYTATPTSREAIELARSVYRRFVAEGLTQAELDSAREYIKGQYAPDAVETPDQAAGMLLALGVDGLARDVVDGLFQRLDALTLEQVNRVVRERFPREALTWVVIGQADVLRPIAADLGLGEVTEVALAAPGFGPR